MGRGLLCFLWPYVERGFLILAFILFCIALHMLCYTSSITEYEFERPPLEGISPVPCQNRRRTYYSYYWVLLLLLLLLSLLPFVW